MFDFSTNWKKSINLVDLARFVGLITGDGHLQLSGGRYLISFYSNNDYQISRLNSEFEQFFGVKGRVYMDKRTKNNKKLFFASKKLALFFKQIGVHPGSKTNGPHLVPIWIMNGHKLVKSAYVRALFDCEGCIYKTKLAKGNFRWRITFEQWKVKHSLKNGIKFMNQLITLLNEFGVITSPLRLGRRNIRKDRSITMAMIFDIESRHFSNFYKHVGFTDYSKLLKLNAFFAEAQVTCAEVSH